MEIQTEIIKQKRVISKKIVVASAVIIVLLIVAVIITPILQSRINNAANKIDSQQRTATVELGDIEVSVSGSAPIEAINKSEITTAVNGKITNVYYVEGSIVKKGDVLLEIDDSDARLSLDKLKNNLAQTELTMQNDIKNLNGLVIKAPFSGIVTNVNFKSGDDVGKGSNICTITDISKLKYTVEFNSELAEKLNTGSLISVTLQDIAQIIPGKVLYIGAKTASSGLTGTVCNVEIMLNNPGNLKEGMLAGAQFEYNGDTQTANNLGKLSYIDSEQIKCSAGGTLKYSSVRENQYVEAGIILFKITNDDLDLTINNDKLKINDFKSQIETAEKQLLDYKVTAPIDGVLTTFSLKVNDAIKQNTATLGTIIDIDNMQFNIDVDELDIAKIAIGQTATITVDALPDTTTAPLIGTVTKIATEGTSSNGVATYPVTIKIEDTADYKIGMSANADVITSSAQGVLRIPLEAVTKMGNTNFVYVKTSETKTTNSDAVNSTGGESESASNNQNVSANASKNNTQTDEQNSLKGSATARMAKRLQQNSSYYKGTIMKQIEVGLNNDAFIEVIDGLAEGDIVVLPPLASASTGATMQPQMGIGGLGGLGGGALGGANMKQNIISGNNAKDLRQKAKKAGK